MKLYIQKTTKQKRTAPTGPPISELALATFDLESKFPFEAETFFRIGMETKRCCLVIRTRDWDSCIGRPFLPDKPYVLWRRYQVPEETTRVLVEKIISVVQNSHFCK